MQGIDPSQVTEQSFFSLCCELIKKAVIGLPSCVEDDIRTALQKEQNPLAREQMTMILNNIDLAKKESLPLCQDTGVPLFFISFGANNAHLDFKKICRDAIRKMTKEIPLRPNVVHPITRKNTLDNTGFYMPEIYFDYSLEKKDIDISFLPKGAGAENMSKLIMLSPSSSKKEIIKHIVKTVASAGGKPCPPVYIGVGLGGTADMAMTLSKKALLDTKKPSNDTDIETLEQESLDAINHLGIGTMGLGGTTSTLGIKINIAHCHTASLPLGITLQCWAHRVSQATISAQGTITFHGDTQ